jgi:hypothetical protein
MPIDRKAIITENLNANSLRIIVTKNQIKKRILKWDNRSRKFKRQVLGIRNRG